MAGLPVTIRLLDPPLHEFLRIREVRRSSRGGCVGINPAERRWRVVKARSRRCTSPTRCSGHRGCRLGITFPEIYEMQVRAIMEAACTVAEQGVHVEPEIMIPLTGTSAR